MSLTGEPTIKRAAEITHESLSKADGVTKAVIFDESDGAPNFRMRRFQFEPGASVPKHTNGIEHELHILEGTCVVGIDDDEHTLTAGDSAMIPAGAVHWFRNDTDSPCAFLCMVPNGDADLSLVDESSSS